MAFEELIHLTRGKQINSKMILNKNPDIFYFVSGPKNVIIDRVVPPEQADNRSLVFASHLEQWNLAIEKKASFIIISENLYKKVSLTPDPNSAGSPALVSDSAGSPDLSLQKTLKYKLSLAHPNEEQMVVYCPSIPLAMACVLPFFDFKREWTFPGPIIDPLASISSTAIIGKNVFIGPFTVIGDHVRIDDNCCISAHVVIQSYSCIGANTRLHPYVFVGVQTYIGPNCEIHPHTTIGADGFGFIPKANDAPIKIPQIGRVFIEEGVEIGANCTIDRPTLSETRIGANSKLDNLIHIGHNSQIGPNCLMAAGTLVSGSVQIGSNCLIGGHVVIADHVRIGNHITLGGNSAITRDLMEAGAYGGYPVEPLKDAVRNIATIAHLSEMRKELKALKKKIENWDEILIQNEILLQKPK